MDPYGRKYSWNDAEQDGVNKDRSGTCGRGLNHSPAGFLYVTLCFMYTVEIQAFRSQESKTQRERWRKDETSLRSECNNMSSTVRNVQVLHLYVQAHNCEAVILFFCFLLYKLVSVCRQRGCIDGSVIFKQAPRNSSRALKSIGHSGQTVSLQHRVMHTASKLFSTYSLYFFFLSITTHKVDPLQSKNN